MEYFQSDKFGSRAKSLMAKHRIPGISAAVVQDQKVVTAAYGKASLDPSRDCTEDTLFDAASCSKSLTAAAVALLIDGEDKIPDMQYDTPVSKLLPDDFVLSDPVYTDSVTVEDMISHRTGLGAHNFASLGPRSECPDDAKSITRNLRNLDIAAPIRTKFIYSNLMYTAATYLVEKMTGLSFSDYLDKRFFQPLGMPSTSLQPSLAHKRGFADRIATGYEWNKKTGEYATLQPVECPESQGAGSIITSAKDYILWVKAMMNQEEPINKAVYKGILKQRIFKKPAEAAFPLSSPDVCSSGFNSFYYRGYAVYGHSGGMPGYGSYHFFVPDFKFGAAIFGNSMVNGFVAVILAFELIDELLNVPEAERQDWEKVILGDHDDEPEDEEKSKQAAREKICPGIKAPEPQTVPLETYTGKYWNRGYHSLTVEIKDGDLFIDASDRSFAGIFRFEHVCEQRKYLVRVTGSEDFGSIEIGFEEAQFKMEGDRVVAMGLDLASDLGKLIWFEKKD